MQLALGVQCEVPGAAVAWNGSGTGPIDECAHRMRGFTLNVSDRSTGSVVVGRRDASLTMLLGGVEVQTPR